jgi:hypothetical protein
MSSPELSWLLIMQSCHSLLGRANANCGSVCGTQKKKRESSNFVTTDEALCETLDLRPEVEAGEAKKPERRTRSTQTLHRFRIPRLEIPLPRVEFHFHAWNSTPDSGNNDCTTNDSSGDSITECVVFDDSQRHQDNTRQRENIHFRKLSVLQQSLALQSAS